MRVRVVAEREAVSLIEIESVHVRPTKAVVRDVESLTLIESVLVRASACERLALSLIEIESVAVRASCCRLRAIDRKTAWV